MSRITISPADATCSFVLIGARFLAPGFGTPAPLVPFLWVALVLLGYPREARPNTTAAAVR